MVLARMGQHDAPFNPVTFTVWYEYAAGMNSHLNQALDDLLQRQTCLSADDMWQLHQAFVADVDPQAMHRIGGELQKVMAGLADAAAFAGDNADAFGEQLGALVADLQTLNQQLTSPSVTDAIEGTARMRRSAQALETEAKSSQSEIHRLQNELTRVRDEALIDALTQVLNRKGFELKMADMLTRAQFAGRRPGLIMLDIDHFKKVNDHHGHVMGDRVLQAVGTVLKSCIPSGSAWSVARYGGEEFAVLLPETTEVECLQLAEQLRSRTQALKVRDRRTQAVVLRVTISGGLALLQPGDDAHALTARADAALYRSKQDGRDRVTCA
jgi:diguanylate cyclase